MRLQIRAGFPWCRVVLVTSYLEVLAGTLTGVLACGLVGGVIAAWLPWRQRPAAQLFLAPLLGAAVFTLLATLVGWVGHGFRAFPCRLVSAILVTLAVWQQRADFPPLLRRAALWMLFGAIGSLPLLHQFWAAGSFSVFNDVFIYIVHGQWLQAHGFTDPSGASWNHPAWLQIAGYQGPHLRMGSSFLLGWIQATAGAEWSIDIFPAVVMVGLVSGTLSIGASVLWVCPRRWLGAWLAALGAAVTLNGFAFGAMNGFLHQTFGIAFGTAALSMWGAALADSGRRPPRLRTTVPIALCTAACVHAYSEFSPFLLASAGLATVLPWPQGASDWRQRWRLAWPTATLVLILVNLEWFRTAQALRESVGIVVGRAFAWSWPRFPLHALGLTAGESRAPWPTIAFMPSALGFWAAALLLTSAFVWLIHRARPVQALVPPARFRVLVPIWVLLGLGTLAFLWFRYVSANPWQSDPAYGALATGQSWHQFKLSNWFSLAAISATVPFLLAGNVLRNHRRLALGALAVWCAAGLAMNLARTSQRIAPLLTAIGVTSNPFGAFHALRAALREVPPTDTIMIESELGENRTRRLLTYYLSDRKLAGRWDNDPGLLPELLPPSQPAPHQWLIRIHPPSADPSVHSGKFGPMTLERADAAGHRGGPD